MQSRRLFMKGSALAMFGVGSLPAWLSRSVYAADSGQRKKILVAIFQRGAVDGLNMVVPFGEPRYYELRPSIAIPKPDGTSDAAIDLDGFFGLHPALAPLKPLYDARHLAIVDAVGSPDPTRSHFDAQDYMESGTPGLKGADGWMNRALSKQALPVERGPVSPVRAVSLGDSLARSMRGHNPAVAVRSLNDFQVHDARGAAAFESMYENSADKLIHGTANDTFNAVKIVQAIQKQKYVPANDASYPNGGFGRSLQQIAQLIKADVGVEVAFADIGGWDTHVNETGGKSTDGQLANNLAQFGQALTAFHQDLGDRMEDVTLVTMSEFGRTVKENGDRGTDHGHANVMFVLGGDVRGGKIYGDWPGLQPEQLYEDRDLALTTDFRDVLGELVSKHLGNPDVQAVFPGYKSPKFRGLLG
ncbi:MAG TPA: DUF1501 domain-containing protein [Bryobacteraceae bacterium]|nr:DUF1501 domain-containing protein [Bryobacteraceae bacterium]